MTPEQFKQVLTNAGRLDPEQMDRDQLLAEVKWLTGRVAELEAHPVDWDAQRRRADELEAEVKRLTAERDAAHHLITRLMSERDTVARAVRSPNLTDAERLEEIREAFAVVDGQRTEAGEGR